MFSDLSYNAHQMTFKLSESKVTYLIQKSFIRDHIYKKWNRHYIAYPAAGQYKFFFPNVQNVPSFKSKEIFRLQTALIAA